jgi:hypothetical protein
LLVVAQLEERTRHGYDIVVRGARCREWLGSTGSIPFCGGWNGPQVLGGAGGRKVVSRTGIEPAVISGATALNR